MKSSEKLSWVYNFGWATVGSLGLFLCIVMLLTSCITVPPYEPPPRQPNDPPPVNRPLWGEDHWDEPSVIIL